MLRERNTPYFIRCFVKLGVLVFLLIITAASTHVYLLRVGVVVEFLMVHKALTMIDSAANTVFLLYRRIYYACNTANSFRTVYDIYQGYEANSSEIFPDRLAHYVQLVPC